MSETEGLPLPELPVSGAWAHVHSPAEATLAQLCWAPHTGVHLGFLLCSFIPGRVSGAEEMLVLAGESPKTAAWSKNQQCPSRDPQLVHLCDPLHIPDTRILQAVNYLASQTRF